MIRNGVRRVRRVLAADEGLVTAEYAIVAIVAAAFGGVLFSVVTGDDIVSAIGSTIRRALTVPF
ncbi:MAG TPA: DUF4244 domain-containing protein [Pseudonocardiaceae bacterium]